jgi:hypothetical protein
VRRLWTDIEKGQWGYFATKRAFWVTVRDLVVAGYAFGLIYFWAI